MSLGWAALGSSLIGAGTSLFGANQQARAQDRAAQMALEMSAPWRAAGERMLGTYETAVNQPFQETPGYQFAFDEAMRAVDRGAAAQGLYGSGARARALQRTATGLADGTYQNWLAALGRGAGLGQGAVQGAMPVVAGAMGNAGTAQGAGIIGAGNAISGGLNNLAMLRMMGIT